MLFCLFSCLKLTCSFCHFTYHTLPYSFIFDVKSYLLQPLKQIWQVLETEKASLRDYNSYTQHWRNIFSNMQERIRFLWCFFVLGRLKRKVQVFIYIYVNIHVCKTTCRFVNGIEGKSFVQNLKEGQKLVWESIQLTRWRDENGRHIGKFTLSINLQRILSCIYLYRFIYEKTRSSIALRFSHKGHFYATKCIIPYACICNFIHVNCY